MIDSKRWTSDGAPEPIARMFRAAQDEQPSQASLARALAGVGLGLGTASAAGSAAASGSAAVVAKTGGLLGSSMLAKSVVFFVSVGGAGGAVVLTQTDRARPPSPVPSASVSRAATGTIRDFAPLPAASAPTAIPNASPTSEVSQPERRSVGTTAPVLPDGARPSEPPIDVERLSEEVRVVDRARSALSSGRAREAIRALDEYEAEFAVRRFEPEALYLRMKALLAMGSETEARLVAERLSSSYPKSPHTARARLVLSGKKP